MMYQMADTTRVSDEYYMSVGQVSGIRSAAGIDHLLMYGQMEIVKKEAARVRFAENMVHLIPVCYHHLRHGFLMFSNPNIEMMSRADSILARTIDGYNNWNDTAVTVGIEVLDPIDGIVTKDSGRNIDNKNQYK
ncbi:uncharacterized protein LOC110039116 [Phalaenopsis equestris]|uniref:uncharacterized protein LOC110039116 n=1 Tax=Phalaenopsis equestris TaxID=78828 RepID=UPI0009E1942E|nr:uncharacterized protein LOC110039116 [Phalaenopsis equestris]